MKRLRGVLRPEGPLIMIEECDAVRLHPIIPRHRYQWPLSFYHCLQVTLI
jgi:hypothetical protein